MSKLAFLLLLLLPLQSWTQQIDYNTSEGYAAEGYDVVAYFNQKVQKGSSKFVVEHDGTKFKFSNQANLNEFNNNPKKYTPQYGGWCAYAMGKQGEKVTIDPETFEIRSGKLYLFYNAFFTNTHNKWKEEGAERLRAQADKNWEEIKSK